MARLSTRAVRDRADVASHFDSIAAEYREAHGPAAALLSRRLRHIERHLPSGRGGALLEIGCGTAIHLLALAGRFDRALGTDLSPEMVRQARRAADRSPWRERVALAVDPSEELATVPDASVDVALAVGSLEHTLDRAAALGQVARVLVPGGTFVCLTPHGGWIWYRHLAPRLGQATRHLSTDRFLDRRELTGLAAAAGLAVTAVETWSFHPRGDLPTGCAPALAALDLAGRLLRIPALRGGLLLAARRPQGVAGKAPAAKA